MDVYFVRHGETKENQAHRYQTPNEPLSDSGSREVAKLTRHIVELQPTRLLTSHFRRAIQTAEFLSYATGLQAERTDFFHEIYRPEYMYGRSHFGLRSFIYVTRWFFGLLPNPDDSRLETRKEFSERVLRARKKLEEHDSSERIVVISHSVFINFFVLHACQDKPMRFYQAVPRLLKILRSENTGVTHLRFNHFDEGSCCRWELVSYDGISHLDE